MEKNCLVTTYKASVDDNSLLKIGEMRFDSGIDEQNNDKYIGFSSYPAVIETLVGSNSLSFDNTFATGLTNKLVLDGNKAFYVKDQNVILRIYDKYNVDNINCIGFIVNLDDLKYCSNLHELIANSFSGSFESIKTLHITKLSGRVKQSNNISSLNGLNSLTSLYLSGSNVSGDISSLSGLTSLTYISLHQTNISGDISSLSALNSLSSLQLVDTNVTGDFSSLSPLTKLNYISIVGSNVSGDISSLSGLTSLDKLVFEHNQLQGNISSLSALTKLTSINLNYTQVTGDISSLSGLTNLTTLMAVRTSISGDISSFGALTKFTYFNCVNTQLSGEIIDYVIAQRSHGRSTGTTNFIVPMSVTFNGQGVTNANISWTASTITNETTSETVNR